jgi:adenylyltransferase/sulfurtransferase
MPDAFERYSRQLGIPGFGREGQERLRSARVTVVGAGGLGSPCLLYLTAAGIGHLQILDHGEVELSNLNRQILYGEADVGKSKAPRAAARLRDLDSALEVVFVTDPLEESDRAIAAFGPHVIVDCLDTLAARLVLNAIARQAGVPLVSAAVEREGGIVTVVYPDTGPCLACLFGEKRGATSPPAVVGYTPGTLGAIEAALAIQIVLGRRPLARRLLAFDFANWDIHAVTTERRADCPVCGDQNHVP